MKMLPPNPRAVPWMNALAVGDEAIDDEHRGLIDASNDLCAMVADGADKATLKIYAEELVSLALAHLANEERLFRSIRYARAADHERAHDAIRECLGGLLPPHDNMEVAAGTFRLMLLEHILRHDLGFKTYVQDRAGH